jgi:hypothetical protein
VLAAGGAAACCWRARRIGAGASLLANQVPRAEEASIDARVLLFVLAASILTGILAGAIPRCAPADGSQRHAERGRAQRLRRRGRLTAAR